MLNVSSQIISNSANEEKYFKTDTLEYLTTLISHRNIRLECINDIIVNASYIISDAVSGVIYENPHLIFPESSYKKNTWTVNLFFKDGKMTLRYISYALLARDPYVLSDYYIHQLKETYSSLKVPVSSIVRIIKIMKATTINLIKDNSHNDKNYGTAEKYSSLEKELIECFDYLILALSN
uniref:Phycoerythrin beta subunit n=1 Tax=Gronococcus sybilensis TaxID=3028029 RepID=A0A9Y1I2H0_9RHOD|nr:phycoerythrin beta subunit [Gronococcus sybilensis]